jgi:hypothetical protein
MRKMIPMTSRAQRQVYVCACVRKCVWCVWWETLWCFELTRARGNFAIGGVQNHY